MSQHHYDGHKTICSAEDKAVAGRLGGHTWNIITNSDEHEIYLTQARSRDHYVNDRGEITSVWFERRRRIPHSVGGLEGANWSANVRESLLCPGTPREHPAKAQRNQLLQAAAPRDFGLYTRRRREVAPPTPEHQGHLDRTLGKDQVRLRDVAVPKMPKVVCRQEWTPRRGEPRVEQKPPKEEEMFMSVGQLRAESHVDVQQGAFAQQLSGSCGSSEPKLSKPGGSGLPDSGVLRAALFSHRSSAGTPKHPDARVNHSQSRMESFAQREISNWALGDDKLLRKDPFCMRPMQQPNNSGVKYDIITNVACIVCISASVEVQCGGIEEDFLEAEEAKRLQVSLLQSSLTVARTKPKAEVDEHLSLFASFASFASPVPGLRSSWLWEVVSLSNYGRAAKAAMGRHLELIRTLPTDRTAVSGLPALVVFMVAALVMVLFVSQMIGAFFEERGKEERYLQGLDGYPKPRWTDLGHGDGQERSTLGRSSLPPMTLPNTPQANSDQWQAQGQASSAVSTLPMLDRLSEPARSGGLGFLGSAGAPEDRSAMCPRLIQPSSEASFHVNSEDLGLLRRGESPVAICGPAGHALLYARFSQDSKGQWLELSTTANTQFPHCRAGPLQLGATAASLDIRGPSGDRYGLLQNRGHHWQLQRAEGVVMSIAASGPGLTATADGPVATAWPERSGLLVKVSPGRDPLLSLLCLLVVLLLSPEFSDL
ncbi:unnamed protein product [Symbiodinium pilosum]|uniref:Uncharacterized protein n=1 Tax=Symbiodinium pilosum TaxID=2952 RepID=A0A812NBA4_SYMPI|nr:unnamed protein product [Symbiodinium pilosum]